MCPITKRPPPLLCPITQINGPNLEEPGLIFGLDIIGKGRRKDHKELARVLPFPDGLSLAWPHVKASTESLSILMENIFITRPLVGNISSRLPLVRGVFSSFGPLLSCFRRLAFTTPTCRATLLLPLSVLFLLFDVMRRSFLALHLAIGPPESLLFASGIRRLIIAGRWSTSTIT